MTFGILEAAERHAAHGRPFNHLLTTGEVTKPTPTMDGRYGCGVQCSRFDMRPDRPFVFVLR